MIYLQADDATLVKELGTFVEPVEITDADGKLLGVFVPANLERGKRLYAELAGKVDPEESREKMRTEGKGRPFAEAIRSLGNRVIPW
jgi:hypothetical protein